MGGGNLLAFPKQAAFDDPSTDANVSRCTGKNPVLEAS